MPKGSKLKGKMSSYAFFVQTCREEQKKQNPDEPVVFSEFSKKCSEKWKVATIVMFIQVNHLFTQLTHMQHFTKTFYS